MTSAERELLHLIAKAVATGGIVAAAQIPKALRDVEREWALAPAKEDQ